MLAQGRGRWAVSQKPKLIKYTLLLGHVHTVPDTFCAGTKMIPGRASVHDWRDFCNGAELRSTDHIKWSVTYRTGSVPHLSAVWTGHSDRSGSEHIGARTGSLSATCGETEVNIQEWGLGLSSPNLLGQTLRHYVRCMWTTCSVLYRCCSRKAIRYGVFIASVAFTASKDDGMLLATDFTAIFVIPF